MAVNWRDVGIFYEYEVRAAVRERSIVLNTFLIPVFLYPVLLWTMFSAIVYVAGQQESFVSRVAINDTTAEHAGLAKLLEKKDNLQLVENSTDVTEATDRIRDDRLDVLLPLTALPAGPDSPPGNFTAEIYFDRARDRSDQARQRLQEVLRSYRSNWLEEEAARLGVSGSEWQNFRLQRKNLASERDMGRFLLAMMLPLFLVIMIAVGCFYPAIDATAGERERSTWETSMSTAASRHSILTAKYLYVATFGSVAGLINVVAMVVSARVVLAPLLSRMGDSFEFRIPWTALPVLALGSIVLALFIAAVMMLLASFARTFREGQSLITPFYLAILLPVVFVRPEQPFTPLIALVPVVNVTRLFGQAITGEIQTTTAAITLVSGLVCVILALRLAALVLRFEDFVIGSYPGSFGKFVKERLLPRKRVPVPVKGED
jgi:sodium transport system permease protein